jgi:hypothetical protein
MPDHTTGDPAPVPTVRVFSGSAALAAGGCPAHRRISADLSRGEGARGADPPPPDAPGAVLDAVLDLVEHSGMALEEACARLSAPGGPGRLLPHVGVSPPHAGLLVWVRHAARCYLEALARDGGPGGARRAPVFDFWVRQYLPVPGSRNSRPYEVCARGRRYAYAQGSDRVRELRIPVTGAAGGGTRPRAEVAVAAYVLATGTAVDRDACAARPGRYRGGAPYPMRGHRGGADPRPPDRVRVVEVSCLDSSTAVLYDGSAAEAAEAFASTGREGLRSALAGGARSPGRDCLSCAGRRGCGRLPRAPGLLGLHGGPRPRRSWSVSAGLRHRSCPAREHFHSLGLPADPGAEAGPLRRDRAVRAWLERSHRRLPRRPCTAEDLPGDRSSWSAGGHRLEGAQARLGAAMIAAHAGVCPLRGLASGSHVRVGHTLAADDTRADVLVLARADVLHHRGRSWIYRAVTTTGGAPAQGGEPPSGSGDAPSPSEGTPASVGGSVLPGDEEALLAAQPRLALAVVLFACGALAPGPDSAVELEVLSPRGAFVRSLDPGSARVRAGARRVVHGLAEPWHGDPSHPPTPGEACRDCPYRRWCPAADSPGGTGAPGAGVRGGGQGVLGTRVQGGP